LTALNPGVENGLSIGQKLNIPIKETLNNTETIQTDPVVNNTFHTTLLIKTRWLTILFWNMKRSIQFLKDTW
jgi:hypothetical protein